MSQSDAAVEARPHPAKFSPEILRQLRRLVLDEQTRRGAPLVVLDPFAGAGRIHDLAEPGLVSTVGVELEPEWAAHHERTMVGDATDLPASWTGEFDVVATSPCYGNRMADLYDGRDGSRRRTYKLSLGRDPSEGSAAGLQWGPAFRELHVRAIAEWERVLRPPIHGIDDGGLALLNTSNHHRGGALQLVNEWFVATLLERGWRLLAAFPVGTSRYGDGANRDLRDTFELITCARPPAGAPSLPLAP